MKNQNNYKSYSEKLKDPRWQKKRLEILNRDEWACQLCGEKEKTLHVHHKNYTYGNEPWDYINTNFLTLCYECHQQEEFDKESLKGLIHDLLLMGHRHGTILAFMTENIDLLVRVADKLKEIKK